MRALLCLLVALALGLPALAQTTVRDSVQMRLIVYDFDYVEDPFRNCGVGIYAIWPDVLADITGETTSYSDYTLVTPNPNGRAEGEYVPRGLGETLSAPDFNIYVPPGFYGHQPQLGTGLQTGNSAAGAETCRTSRAKWRADAARLLGGTWSLLNGGPFRITEWYAAFDVPDGEAVALFDWRQTQSNAVAFDASFPDFSYEVDATQTDGKLPVASYAWDFGDGQSGTGATPTHTYTTPGTYVVTLTVTDDDGDTDSQSETIAVTEAVLTVRVDAEDAVVRQGDDLDLTATITNTGTQGVANVTVYRQFVLEASYPDDANVARAVFRDPTFTAVEIEPDPVTQAVLQPGESITVEGRYTVAQVATYRPPGASAFVPVDAEVQASVLGIGATSGTGDPVAIIDACARDACEGSDVTLVDDGVGTDTETASEVGLALAVYPNPAVASVQLPYAVPEAGPVRLGVYDALGREVARLVDGPRPAGPHEAVLDAGALPVGVYLVRLEADGEVRVQRLTVVR